MEQFQNEGMAEDDEKDRETKIWMRKQWSLSRHGVVTRNIQCSWNCSRLLPLVWVPTLSPNKVFRNWESWFGRTSQPCSPRIATTFYSSEHTRANSLKKPSRNCKQEGFVTVAALCRWLRVVYELCHGLSHVSKYSVHWIISTGFGLLWCGVL